MEKTLKKVLTSLLVVAMVLTAVPLSGLTDWIIDSAAASGDFVYGNLLYNTSNVSAGVKITGCIDSTVSGELIIPSEINGNTVTEIDKLAFRYSGYTSVIVPSTVREIGIQAFKNSKLMSAVIGNGVTNIGASAFEDCVNLTNVVINSAKNLGETAFYNCSSLKSITLCDGLESIGWSAFENCTSLQNITIPESVTFIGGYAFSGCSRLSNITIPDGVTEILMNTFMRCYNLKTVKFSSNITRIGTAAFTSCISLTSINIPEGVTIISDSAFDLCTHLNDVTIPNSVTIIGQSAFHRCSNLLNLKVPDSVNYIDESAFFAVNNIEYNGTAEGSPWDAKSVNGYIEDNLVYESSLKKSFLGCPSAQEGTVTIPDSVTTIGDYAFISCILKNIIIPSGVTSIGKSAFYQCSDLENLVIPESVTSIGEEAFYQCTGLNYLIVPDSVTNIGRLAFYDVEKVLYNGTLVGSWGAKAVCRYYLEDGLLFSSNLKETLIGCPFVNESMVIIPDSVQNIDNKAFYKCEGLENIVIGSNVKNIGIAAFAFCSELTSVTIPDSVTSIGEMAFYFCDLDDVYYSGTKEQWDEISVGESNEYLLNATIHYNVDLYSHYTHFYVSNIIKEATCAEEGVMKYVCSCGKSYTKIIKAKGHDFVDGICTRCGKAVGELYCIELDLNGGFCEQDSILLYDGVVYGELPYATNMNPNCLFACWVDDNGRIVKSDTVFHISDTQKLSVEWINFNVDYGYLYGEIFLYAEPQIIADAFALYYNNLTGGLISINPQINTKNGRIGTGSVVAVPRETISIVVFGDVNGDGWYDGTDAIKVNLLANGLLTKDDVSEAEYLAADCNHDGVIDALDVEVLEYAGILLADIDQTKSEEELLETSAYVEYLNLIDQTVETETAEVIEDEPVNPVVNPFASIISFIKDFIQIIKSAIAFINADMPGLPFSLKNK